MRKNCSKFSTALLMLTAILRLKEKKAKGTKSRLKMHVEWFRMVANTYANVRLQSPNPICLLNA